MKWTISTGDNNSIAKPSTENQSSQNLDNNRIVKVGLIVPDSIEIWKEIDGIKESFDFNITQAEAKEDWNNA